MRAIGRRELLRATAAAAATTAFGGSVLGAAPGAQAAGTAAGLSLPVYVGAGSTAPVRPFALQAVQLGASVFQEKRDRMKAFIAAFDERRFLVPFNQNCGRPNPAGVAVVGGWEGGTQLTGHWTGYYLSALAQAYSDAGEQVYLDKINWMVGELAAVQTAITAMASGQTGGSSSVGRVAGKFGQALQLGGTSTAEYVQLPAAVLSGLTSFTVATWINRTTTTGQNWARVFDFGSGTSSYMFLTVSAGGGGARFAISTGGSGAEQQITAASPLPTGWTHVAVTLSGGTGTLYVNGTSVAVNKAVKLTPASLTGTNNLWIGRSQFGDPMLQADVDEFQIYNRALSQTEIQSLLTSAGGSPGGGNVAWYRFEEAGGTNVVDSSSHQRPATVVAAAGTGTGATAAWTPTYPGYLGAIPDDVVLRLGPPRFATYGGDTGTWAPWYTQHFIMQGLMDCYLLAGNTQALQVVTTMADWANLALTQGDIHQPGYPGPITRDDLNLMWDTYIAGEFNAAAEPIAEVYAITGNTKYLDTAKLLENRESLFGACAANEDILTVSTANNPGPRRPNRLHANQHIPNNLGYLRIYEQTGEAEYLQVAQNFFGMVVPHRMYAIGGTGGSYPGSNSNNEQFQNRDDVANAITQSGSETEATHSLVQLARNLFFHVQDPAYIDYYERAVVNQLLGSRMDSDSTSDPLITYFQSLAPGAARSFGNLGTGDGGAGLEDQTKYQELIYAQSADASTLWVNLYIASTLEWSALGLTIVQATDFPRGDTSSLTIQGQGTLAINLRVPAWAKSGFTVQVNGVNQQVTATPGSYVTLNRTWHNGDRIDIAMPFSIRMERAIDQPEIQSVFWGPLLLAILGDPGNGQYRQLTLYQNLKLDGDYTRAAITPAAATAAGDPTFAAGGLTLRPWYIGDTQPQSAYFQRVEPEIVFGSIDSGVANKRRNDHLPNYDLPVTGVTSPGTDGLTFLDIVWDQAPFANQAAFVAAVTQTATNFVTLGLFTAQEKSNVVSAAGRASSQLAP
ncbi:beta-L-arabinofuranosidase domain-containing protein, partial [Actinospica robiniae]|uniref:beta-L-arabinofuranosidase domain-containing protein n=1 Tax=Actinospica robiniae TaxID=304901 RepID=UPI00040CAA0B